MLLNKLIILKKVTPWNKKIHGNIGNIYLGDKTGPVIIKKYNMYDIVT